MQFFTNKRALKRTESEKDCEKSEKTKETKRTYDNARSKQRVPSSNGNSEPFVNALNDMSVFYARQLVICTQNTQQHMQLITAATAVCYRLQVSSSFIHKKQAAC